MPHHPRPSMRRFTPVKNACAHRKAARTLLGVLAIALTSGSPGAAPGTLVVDADGAASATSCSDTSPAFRTVSAAVAAAAPGDLVLVCPGTYVENVRFSAVGMTVRSVSGAAVTVLDGGSVDSTVTFDPNAGPAATLEGFTIRNGLGRTFHGGGLTITEASPIIRDNVITGNKSCDGAGIFVQMGSPLIERNTITGNLYDSCVGGGLGGGGAAMLGGAAVVRNNAITDNITAGLPGAGMVLLGAAARIEGNVIARNSTQSASYGDGGAIAVWTQSDADIIGNVMVGNRAARGGGLYWRASGSNRGPWLVNNTVADNEATVGSAVYAEGYELAGRLVVNNLLIARPGRSAVFCSNWTRGLSGPTFISNDVFSAGEFAYSGSCTDQTGQNGNISVLPQFVNVRAGDYHLHSTSPAIDAGDGSTPLTVAVDMDGAARILDGNSDGVAIVDVGADEFVPGTYPGPPPGTGATLVVDHDGFGDAADCSGTATAITSIAAAMDTAIGGDTILVCPGTYAENLDFAGKSIAVRSVAGPATTVVDGRGVNPVVTFANAEGRASVIEGLTLRNGRGPASPPSAGMGGGIRIRNASPTIRGNVIANNRGCEGIGISVELGSPLIEDNVVSGNVRDSCTGAGGGAGISYVGGATFIRGNRIVGNVAANASDGGGLLVSASGPVVVSGNVITGNVVYANSTGCVSGGGVALRPGTNVTLIGNLIAGNSAPCGGGVFWDAAYNAAGPTLINNTIVDNVGATGSGVMATGENSSTTLVNNVIGAPPGATAVLCRSLFGHPQPTFRSNDVFAPSGATYAGECTDQTGRNGNVSFDAGFVNAPVDYHLKQGSPAVDSGEGGVSGQLLLDLDGEPRVVDGNGDGTNAIDIGADEFGGTWGGSSTVEWQQRFGLSPSSGLVDDGPDGDPDHDGLTNLQEYRAGTHPRGFHASYFAEGATGGVFDTQFALLNLGTGPARVLLRFLLAGGLVRGQSMVIGTSSRATVRVDDVATMGNAEFSTVVESDEPVAADRTMTWDAAGYGSHAETSTPAASPTWYFAEGATHSGFDVFYLVQNPNATPASVELTFLLPPPAAPYLTTLNVPAHARKTFWANLDPALRSTDLSAVVAETGGQPIVVERAMYRTLPGAPLFAAGHDSVGVTSPATRWFLAEGATGDYFDLFVLVGNPTTEDAEIELRYLPDSGQPIVRRRHVRAKSRTTVWVDTEDPLLASTTLSTTVTSLTGVPIVVERAMWWPGPPGAWQEAHNSFGSTTTAFKWALAEGETGGPHGTQTFVLVANTSSHDGLAIVTLEFEDGTTTSRSLPLPANSRRTSWIGVDFPSSAGRRYGVVVESVPVDGSPAAAIVVERAMYSDAPGVHWAAGTNALGRPLP